jgi:hypothetical protein
MDVSAGKEISEEEGKSLLVPSSTNCWRAVFFQMLLTSAKKK